MENHEKAEQKQHKRFLFKAGGILVILSFVFYGGLLLVPFLPVSTATKVTISASLVILGEISIWLGGLILGKEIINKYKNKFNMFRKRKKGM
ncbi:transporter suffix domain-containing protein [Bacillus sp. 165]|uniref:transporter suffix domain-containing protein n=1 Tax=Bacillus sp. 165 TaxID=1529117 RepID=UPI001ADAAB66|nr:transporter suffix domain-containing protein [Bacillus sp. 165]MBO9129072.1 transporter suffix domain-containing protein [Bacillus sp. 165]